MRKYPVIAIGAFLSLSFLCSCTKDEFTLPANVELDFQLVDKEIMTGLILPENLYVNIATLSIEGRRPVGEDIVTSLELKEADEEEGFAIYPLQEKDIVMELPSGPYNQLRLAFEFDRDESEDGLSEDIDDWQQDEEEDLLKIEENLGGIVEDYLDGLYPSLLLKARYTQVDGYSYIVFVLNDFFELNTALISQGSTSEISLHRNSINQITIQLDPEYWFALITPSMLNSAIRADIGGEKYIFIHKTINEGLFSTINNRIEESTRIVLNGG